MSTPQKNTSGTPFRVSKMVTDRQKAAQDLGAVLDRHGEETNSTFAALVEPYLREGEEAPNLLFLQEILRRRLEDLNSELVDADEETLGERRMDHALRRQRDAAVGRLANLLSRLRAAADATYGPGATAQALGIEGPMPRDPVVLHRLALRVMEELHQRPFADLEPQVRGISLDSTAWVEDLREPTEELGTILRDLTAEDRDSISALIRKRQAMQTYDVAYRSLLQVMEGLLLHTGLEELATTVRPAPRRRPRDPEARHQEAKQQEAKQQEAHEEPSAPELDEPPIPAGPDLRLLRGGALQQSQPLHALDIKPRARDRDPTTS